MSNSLGGIENISNTPTSSPIPVKRPEVRIGSTTQKSGPPEKFTSSALNSVRIASGTPLSEVKRVPYIGANENGWLRDQLKPGDIFLSYYPISTDAIAGAISTGQNIAKKVKVVGTNESHNFVHAALHVGGGRLSEAVGDGIRINDLASDRFKLKPGMEHSFLVVRPKNERLGLEAARIANELSAQEPTDATSHEYSILKALGALVSDGKLEKDGVKRYLKGAAYAFNGIQPTDANGIREFFCSYFIGWAFQAGESKEVIAEVNKSLPKGMQEITFPKVDPNTPVKDQGLFLEKWATDTASTYYELLKDKISLDLDPKLSTPQHLYLFFLQHPELFTQEMMIVAPPESMEMQEMGSSLQANANSINSLAVSSLHLQPLAEGKDKRVFVVSKEALLQMPIADQHKLQNLVFIAPIKANREKLVKEEYGLMQNIHDQLDVDSETETHLALDFDKITTSDGKEYYVTKKALANGEKAIRDPALPFETRLSFCEHVLDGGSALHGTNRVHGDLKPDNLLIFENETLKIADFGKSATVDDDKPSTKTYSGNTRFCPPEGKLSKAGDVYGAGLILIRILEEACLNDSTSLIDISEKKNPPAYTDTQTGKDSRRGVEKYILDNPAFTRSYETKGQTLFGGRAKDLAARAKTVTGAISQKDLNAESVALNDYITTLCNELLENKFLDKEKADELGLLLIDMTSTAPQQRPTMQEASNQFKAIFKKSASDSDTESSSISSRSNSASYSSSYESELYNTHSITKPLLIKSSKVSALGEGKVNVVYDVTYEERDLLSGQKKEVTRVFKPNPPAESTLIEKLWGTAKGSGIPVGKEANLSGRAVASSVVDRLLFRDMPISVNTRFAIVNGQRGIVMDKAIGKSPEVTGQSERDLGNISQEFKEMIGEDEPLTPEILNFYARMTEADRVEVRQLPDGTETLVAVNKTYKNFSPDNVTTAEGLLKLQILDIICGQVDRHPGNYFIDGDGNVTGIDQDCAFGINAMPRGVDVRNQPSLGGIVPNMGSLMLRFPTVITKSIAEDVLTLWEDRETLKASLASLITDAEISATLDRLERLVDHIKNREVCLQIEDGQLINLAKDSETRPEAERFINSDNSYWGREVYKFRSGETNLNYLRSSTK